MFIWQLSVQQGKTPVQMRHCGRSRWTILRWEIPTDDSWEKWFMPNTSNGKYWHHFDIHDGLKRGSSIVSAQGGMDRSTNTILSSPTIRFWILRSMHHQTLYCRSGSSDDFHMLRDTSLQTLVACETAAPLCTEDAGQMEDHIKAVSRR